MEENLRDKLIQIWENCHINSRRVGNIISSYFGADCVDYQEKSIEEVMGQDLFAGKRSSVDASTDDTLEATYKALIMNTYASTRNVYPIAIIHFPEVTVTNEYNESVDITHFYVRVQIRPDGKMVCRFDCSRSEYPMSHILANYMHSHVSGIPIRGSKPWVYTCTGSDDTPINTTMSTLFVTYDPFIWRMFCVELNNFTQVESVAGTPYHRLKLIGTEAKGNEEDIAGAPLLKKHNSDKGIVKDFLNYYIDHNNLKFVYSQNNITLGMSLFEYRVDLTRKFIEWFNLPENPYNKVCTKRMLYTKKVLKDYIIMNSKVYDIHGDDRINSYTISSYDGSTLFIFKGEPVKVNIIGNSGGNNNLVTLVEKEISVYILSAILSIVNFNYGTTQQTDGNSSSTSGRRIYL